MRSESSPDSIVLDTKPLIKLFAGEEGWEDVQEILSQVEQGRLEAAISVVTLTEVYYKYVREQRIDLAKTRTEQLRRGLNIGIIPVGPEVAVQAGELKGKYPVSIADAFIAACARVQGASVVSDDPEFSRMVEVTTITEKELRKRLRLSPG